MKLTRHTKAGWSNITNGLRQSRFESRRDWVAPLDFWALLVLFLFVVAMLSRANSL